MTRYLVPGRRAGGRLQADVPSAVVSMAPMLRAGILTAVGAQRPGATEERCLRGARRARHLWLDRAPHLHLAVAHPHLKRGLGVGGGAAQGDAIREAIAARVPRADDTPILGTAFVERPALTSTSLEERV